VPPRGLHLVTFGSEIEQSGVFVSLLPSTTCAMSWDAQAETLRLLEDAAQIEQLTRAVQGMEHDACLGPYPLATERQWAELSGFVDESVLRRASVPVGTFIVSGGIDHEEADDDAQSVTPYFEGAARVAHFVQLDPKKHERGRGRTGAALSQFHLDRTEWLYELLTHEYSGGGCAEATSEAAEAALLGELQLAFLLFLRLSSLRALEQWKACLHLLCHCESALVQKPRLYGRLLPIVRAQLTLAPRDFFEDELSADNFLRGALASLAELSEGQPLAPPLQLELSALWTFLAAHFGITLEALRAGSLDDEDEPVVVVTE